MLSASNLAAASVQPAGPAGERGFTRAPTRRDTMARGKRKTIAVSFKESLAGLMHKMQMASPHFVRCIKPNADRTPLQYDPKFVLRQLQYAGVMETIRIRKEVGELMWRGCMIWKIGSSAAGCNPQGFPIRLRYPAFVEEFGVVAFELNLQSSLAPTSSTAQRILAKTGGSGWLLGKTKIFLKEQHRKDLIQLKSKVRRWAMFK